MFVISHLLQIVGTLFYRAKVMADQKSLYLVFACGKSKQITI